MNGKAISEDERRRLYLERLQFRMVAPGTSVKAALDRAHDLRRFEIENYWKRSTYFWGFQLAALAALAIARPAGGNVDPLILMIVSILGMTTAYTGVLTAKGSKFWQRNWEYHVDLLEDEVEGLLHKTVLTKDEQLAPSVSHANERLLKAITAGWMLSFLAGAMIYAQFDQHAAISVEKTEAIIFLIGVATASMIWMRLTPRSDLPDRAYRFQTMERLGS